MSICTYWSVSRDAKTSVGAHVAGAYDMYDKYDKYDAYDKHDTAWNDGFGPYVPGPGDSPYEAEA